MSVKIEIVKNEVKPFIDKLIKKLRDPSAALNKLGVLEVSQTKLRFRRQLDPQGNAWRPLDSSTIRQKNSAVILKKTGRLSQSINHVVLGNRLFVGTNVKYGKFHQEGRGNNPIRQFLGVNERTRQNAETVIKQFLGF